MRLSDTDIEGLIAEAKVDEVGLWLIIAWVKRHLKVSNDESVRRATLNSIRSLLESGDVKVGNYLPDQSGHVEAWDLDHAAILTRIEKEWNALGHDPSFSEVVVFVGNDSPRLI